MNTKFDSGFADRYCKKKNCASNRIIASDKFTFHFCPGKIDLGPLNIFPLSATMILGSAGEGAGETTQEEWAV